MFRGTSRTECLRLSTSVALCAAALCAAALSVIGCSATTDSSLRDAAAGGDTGPSPITVVGGVPMEVGEAVLGPAVGTTPANNGERFALVPVFVANGTAERISLGAGAFSLEFGVDGSADGDAATDGVSDGCFTTLALNPGRQTTCRVAFRVPADAEPHTLVYRPTAARELRAPVPAFERLSAADAVCITMRDGAVTRCTAPYVRENCACNSSRCMGSTYLQSAGGCPTNGLAGVCRYGDGQERYYYGTVDSRTPQFCMSMGGMFRRP